MKVLVVVPAFNEEASIGATLNDLISHSGFDIVVVDDGSVDCTSGICAQLRVNCISLPFNMGLAGAFQTGMRYAYDNGYDAIIQFDADGQHLAKYIDSIITELNNGYDVVIGSRFKCRKPERSMRQFGAALIRAGIKLTTGKWLTDPTSGMRAYSRRIIDTYVNGVNFTPEPDTIAFFIRNGAHVKEIQVEMRERMAGVSYLNSWNSVKYMIRMTMCIFFIQFCKEKISIEEKVKA